MHISVLGMQLSPQLNFSLAGNKTLTVNKIAHSNILCENHDNAITMSSSSSADPGLSVAFRYLNV